MSLTEENDSENLSRKGNRIFEKDGSQAHSQPSDQEEGGGEECEFVLFARKSKRQHAMHPHRACLCLHAVLFVSVRGGNIDHELYFPPDLILHLICVAPMHQPQL